MALAAANWMLDMRHRGKDGKDGLGEYHDGTFTRAGRRQPQHDAPVPLPRRRPRLGLEVRPDAGRRLALAQASLSEPEKGHTSPETDDEQGQRQEREQPENPTQPVGATGRMTNQRSPASTPAQTSARLSRIALMT
jgi:hypothetical protein